MSTFSEYWEGKSNEELGKIGKAMENNRTRANALDLFLILLTILFTLNSLGFMLSTRMVFSHDTDPKFRKKL
jgi:hypothetical protein